MGTALPVIVGLFCACSLLSLRISLATTLFSSASLSISAFLASTFARNASAFCCLSSTPVKSFSFIGVALVVLAPNSVCGVIVDSTGVVNVVKALTRSLVGNAATTSLIVAPSSECIFLSKSRWLLGLRLFI